MRVAATRKVKGLGVSRLPLNAGHGALPSTLLLPIAPLIQSVNGTSSAANVAENASSCRQALSVRSSICASGTMEPASNSADTSTVIQLLALPIPCASGIQQLGDAKMTVFLLHQRKLAPLPVYAGGLQGLAQRNVRLLTSTRQIVKPTLRVCGMDRAAGRIVQLSAILKRNVLQ